MRYYSCLFTCVACNSPHIECPSGDRCVFWHHCLFSKVWGSGHSPPPDPLISEITLHYMGYFHIAYRKQESNRALLSFALPRFAGDSLILRIFLHPSNRVGDLNSHQFFVLTVLLWWKKTCLVCKDENLSVVYLKSQQSYPRIISLVTILRLTVQIMYS